MNKPLLIILVLIAAALAGYLFVIQSKEPPTTDGTTEGLKRNPFDRVPASGVETDEEPEFEVTVTPKMSGVQKRITFEITETHGWWVTMVKVEALHGTTNADTGEFEPDGEKVPMLCPEVLEFDKPLVCETTLTNVDLRNIGGELGEPENWQGQVYAFDKVFKPK
ncbi:MAG: hypothetical protein GY778_03710 [bacterium]|nr:hypothetical protein [bacterium]